MNRMTVAQFRKRGLFNGKVGKSKYKNNRTFYNGRWYDSEKEARRAGELDLMLKAGVVKKWTPQVKFDFIHDDKKICAYVLDFLVEYKDGTTEYEDVKGFKTSVYKLKKKMMKTFYDIDIKEI